MARSQVRISREMREIVDFIKAEHLRRGKNPPTVAIITRAMARKIKKEDLLRDEFIRF